MRAASHSHDTVVYTPAEPLKTALIGLETGLFAATSATPPSVA